MAKKKSSVNNRVRELREAHGAMTQQSLADALGVARQTVIAIEQGRFCPSLETALRLANVFDAHVEDIFELDN